MAIGLSPAGMQLFGGLGYGGEALQAATAEQADELRKKRLAQMQAGGPMAMGTRAAMASPLGQYLGRI